MIVPVAVFLRDRPEDLGLLPDGDAAPESDALGHPSEAKTTEESWTMGEVLRDGTFWKLLSVGVTFGMIGTGLVFHQETILAAHGLSKSLAMSLISFQAFIGTVAAPVMGWLSDRCRAERMMAVSMLLLSLAVACLYFLPHPSLVYVFATLVGLGGAILRTAGTVVWVNYYGRGNQGVIRGAANSGMILAAAAGPLPLAMSNDSSGSYGPALFAFMVIPLLSMIFVATARQPRRRSEA